MNRVYFVRHAKPDFSVHEDEIRPLTQEGIEASNKLVDYFKDKNISKIYSSPYKRSIDTIKGISEYFNIDTELIHDFRERKVSDTWIEDFNSFSLNQWNDFNYKLQNGESLKEVQDRNIVELHRILNENNNENIVIGTHGTSLSTIINYYDNNFNHESFNNIKDIMPWIVYIEFEDNRILNINQLVEI